LDYQKKVAEDYIQICNILRMAGNVVVEYYNNETFTIELKSDQSPVTSADLASDRIITDALKGMYPDLKVLSEESNTMSYEFRKSLKYLWILDPLDGTKEFLNRTDEFSINLALIQEDTVVAGFIYLPVFGQVYYAIKDRGAFCIDVDGLETRINVNQFTLNDKGLKVLASRSHLDQKTKAYIDVLKEPQIIYKGSAIKFISIATGEADYYPRMLNIMEWDTAAGQIIIEESGGSLVDADSGLKLSYNKPSLLNPYFIAAGQMI
jgi:3'(2'), 5'-bisphosphate nucleotidase